MRVFAISLNYKAAPVEVREALTLGAQEQDELLRKLKDAGIGQAVYLTTCNRSELYGAGNYRAALEIFAAAGGMSMSELIEHVFIYEDKKAIRHLMRVAAGMESMVYGEDEILRQCKEAYAASQAWDMTGYELNMIFQAAFMNAKKIKTNTRLSKASVSVATLAASRVHQFIKDKENPKVMIIGAGGDTGSKVMKDLLSYGDCEIYVTEHRRHITQEGVVKLNYHDRYDLIPQMDAVVSATKSPHYLISAARLDMDRLKDKPRLFADLAVPSDIDSHVAENGNAEYISIDDFERIAAENQKIKEEDISAAEDYLEESLSDVAKDLVFHRYLDAVKRGAYFADASFRKFLFNYKEEANDIELEHFLKVLIRLEASEEL